jgi:osmoprotectant transport system permease protein
MTNLAALVAPLAAVGEVGEGFFKERTTESLGCVAKSSNLFCFGWARENIGSYATPARQQLEMVVIAVLIGFVIAFALALLARRFRYLEPPLLAGTGILFAIPSVAFFILLLPITGRGRETAIVALSAYTLQIIYRNVMVGLHNVPESAKDAARGMGLTERQILWKVEVPLAIPEIVAGLRVAVVSTMAIATLAILVNAGGLGAKIYGKGLLTFPTTIILAGLIAIVLALLLDGVLLVVQRLITPWRRVQAVQ